VKGVAQVALEIGSIVAEVIEDLAPLGERTAVALRLERDGWLRVLGARRGLRQAFVNVVRNAIEHSPSGHAVCIRVAGEGPRVIVDVHDDGGGVPAPLRDRVFEAFYSTRPGGDGLGLAVAASVVQAHGGSVRFVESNGCTVRIELPRSDCA